MVDAIIMPKGHKVWAEKTYSSPEINMTLFDDEGEVRVGLTVEEAQGIMESLQREIKEHADFYARIREEEKVRRSCQKVRNDTYGTT